MESAVDDVIDDAVQMEVEATADVVAEPALPTAPDSVRTKGYHAPVAAA